MQMKLIVEISEDDFELLKLRRYPSLYEDAILKGVPFPKGHGRLIDADDMWDIYHSNDYDFYEALDDAPTIIEADKAESEET